MGKDWLDRELVELTCKRCDFYQEDERELRCAAFKALLILLREGVITLDEVENTQKE